MSKMEKRIYYHDTDCGGVVYYANYLKYLEEARTEYMRQRGLDIKELSEQGIMFVVKRVEIDYKMSARYSDVLTIDTIISKAKNVSLIFSQTINREDTILSSALTTLVCVNPSFRPVAIPSDLLDKLTQ